MRTHWALTSLIAGALLVPVAGYSADMKDQAATKTESAKEYVSDAAITATVKTEFAKDKQVSATKIKVETDHGVVKLSGNAGSKDEADRAVAIARGTKGVASVTNDIQVGAPSAKY
jgi:hyperosmotically inducible periplasmic protein